MDSKPRMTNEDELLPPASILIRKLLDQRRDSGTENRKIIFIAHGLGCFICQYVILAEAHTEMFSKITAGILFINPTTLFSEHSDLTSSPSMKRLSRRLIWGIGELMVTPRHPKSNALSNIKTLLIRQPEDFKSPCSNVSAFLVCLDFMLIEFTV